MRLVVCSNSHPSTVHETAGHDTAGGLRPDGAGGLVPHLLSLLGADGGTWLFADDGSAGQWPDRVGDVELHPVRISTCERRGHYERISIDVLQRVFHYLHTTAFEPAFDEDLAQAWNTYRAVNEAFAGALGHAAAVDSDDAVVLINDYHLLLVAGMVRRANAHAGARIVYSHGVPWCEPDYFSLLPTFVRKAILTSLLCCDDVVFHASRWRDAFARCCARHLRGADVSDDVVGYNDHVTRMIVSPFPLDSETVQELRDGEGVARWRSELQDIARGRHIVVRVDRLDLWKNHLRGFAAFDALLRRRPQLVDDVWFLAVTTPPRYQSPEHLRYAEACRTAVAAINETWRAGRSEPVLLLGPGTPDDVRARAIAALELASTVLVNPTFEGFSVVAKEAVFLGEASAVLLSTTAGAYEQLASTTVPLDPFDVVATTDALEAAVTNANTIDVAVRGRWRERIRSETARDWLSTVTGDGRTHATGC
jgi:trehalose 6-phosphate synthase